MNSNNLRLLAIFDAVASAGSVSGAAEILGLSQPAISHALNRLRDLTGDKLFVRSRHGMQPTRRAKEMLIGVSQVIANAQALISLETFDPNSSNRQFRIGASDYSAVTVMPSLIALVQKKAPVVKLDFVQIGKQSLADLCEGKLDICLWGTKPPMGHFHSTHLFRESFLAVISKRHPIAKNRTGTRMSLKDYLAWPHVKVSMDDPGPNTIELTLQQLKLERLVVASSQGFLTNLQCVRSSNLISTIPRRLCQKDLMHGLVAFELPFKSPSYEYSLIWHDRANSDPGVRWLRACVELAAQKTAA